MSEDISVEVVVCPAAQAGDLALEGKAGCSWCRKRSGSPASWRNFPEIDLASAKVGIFGKLVKLDTVLRDKDRVEIYRPLIADPKEVRRKRAAEGKDEEGSRRRPKRPAERTY